MTPHIPNDPPPSPLFDALRTELANHNSAPRVEQALMAAFAKQQRRPWHHVLTGRQWGMAGGLGTCMMALLVLTVSLKAPPDQGGALPHAAPANDGPFIALASLERIEGEAAPQLIDAHLSGAELASLGVPITPETAGASVHAEMLVSAEGQPLALRLSAIQ
jgi:hypothetical protein